MVRLVDRELTPLCAVLMPTAAEVDRLVTLLLVVFTLVDSDPTSVDSCVDSAPRVLLVVVRLVDRELTPLCAVLIPAAAEVDRLATLLFVVFTLVDSDPTSVDSWVDSAPRVLLVVFRLVDREVTPLCAVLMPIAAEVDRLATLLLVVFTLVDSDPTSVDSWVDSAPRVLLVVVRLVDSEVTPLCAVLMPAAAEVDRLATLLFVVFTLVDSDPTSVDS
nr:hypothetical protein [Burkholderia sp. S-53]